MSGQPELGLLLLAVCEAQRDLELREVQKRQERARAVQAREGELEQCLEAVEPPQSCPYPC